jgi:TonB family protein
MSVCPIVAMSSLVEISKKWEGRLVDGKFPLRQWVGGSDHSSVFVTERGGTEKVVIKLISAQDHFSTSGGNEGLLSRWAVSSRISHPNLIRLFEFGRCQIENDPFLYVVMEYAEENLGQIIPQRRLSTEEAAQMLPPIVEALSFLHDQGFVHGGIKPSNILAVADLVKISSDNLHHIGEPAKKESGEYTAPESETALSPASDVWSVGAILVAALSQQIPGVDNRAGSRITLPDAIPDPYRRIAQRCLRVNPEQRCTLHDILKVPSSLETESPEKIAPKPRKRWWTLIVILACIAVLALVGSLTVRHKGSNSSETRTEQIQPAPQSASPTAPKLQNQPGSVLHQALPDISRQAQNTIHGRVKVSVQVAVDTSGNVVKAKLVSAGPSRYFARKALEASQGWKFASPQEDGQPLASTWHLRFEFARGSTHVVPTEVKP